MLVIGLKREQYEREREREREKERISGERKKEHARPKESTIES